MPTTQKWLTLVLACFALLNLRSNVQAQKPATPQQLVSALIDQNVAREIELVDGQQDMINELLKELVAIRTTNGTAKRLDFRNAPAEDRQKIESVYLRRYETFQSKIADKMRDTLLPFQIERLEQVILQKELRPANGRNSGRLLTPSMIEYLEINEEQQQRIKNKSQQLNAEIDKEIRKIVDRAKQELLDELSVDQKSKYKKLLGEPMRPETQKLNPDAETGK